MPLGSQFAFHDPFSAHTAVTGFNFQPIDPWGDGFRIGLVDTSIPNLNLGDLTKLNDLLTGGPDDFWLVNGKVAIRVTGGDLTDNQIGNLEKILNEFDESSELASAFQYFKDNNVKIVLHLDGQVWGHNGVVITTESLEGRFGVISENLGPNGRPAPGSEVHISLNPSAVGSTEDFAVTLLHEIFHTMIPGANDSEVDVEALAQQAYQNIYFTNGGFENDWSLYANAGIGIGTSGNDVITGTSAFDNFKGADGNDTFYGNGGDDILDGEGGNDTIFAGAGNDILIAGPGTDALYGSSGDDWYIFTSNIAGSVGDTSGSNDWIDIRSTSDVFFSQSGAALEIIDLNGGTTLTVFNWYNNQQIETVSLANGTVLTAQEVEALAADPGGQGGLGFPIVIDLDGDGIELISLSDSNVKFDWDGDGQAEKSGWLSSDDGILVFDFNQNGKVDGAQELSFTQYVDGARTDLEGLAGLDENGDGLITAADSAYHDMYIWQDKTSNGKSTHNELTSLADAGVVSIDLNGVSEIQKSADNLILGSTEFLFDNGLILNAYDVAFKAENDLFTWESLSDVQLNIMQYLDQLIASGNETDIL